MAFSVVVLPVPGPPVRIRKPFSIADLIASICFSAYWIFSSCCIFSIRVSVFENLAAGKLCISLILFAMKVSALCISGKKIKFLSSKFSRISDASKIILLSASFTRSVSTCRKFVVVAMSLSSGKQVWPFCLLWFSTWAIPALTLFLSSIGLSCFLAIISAISKLTLSPLSQSVYGLSLIYSRLLLPKNL